MDNILFRKKNYYNILSTGDTDKSVRFFPCTEGTNRTVHREHKIMVSILEKVFFRKVVDMLWKKFPRE